MARILHLHNPKPWKNELRIKDILAKATIKKTKPYKVASELAKRITDDFNIMELSDQQQHNLFTIVSELRLVSDNKNCSEEDINDALDTLYDWADEDKTCWIS